MEPGQIGLENLTENFVVNYFISRGWLLLFFFYQLGYVENKLLFIFVWIFFVLKIVLLVGFQSIKEMMITQILIF